MEYNKIGCIIMASGLSKRFGKNKLMEEFNGKSLIQWILDLTREIPWRKRIVLTRSAEVQDLCKKQGIPVLFHEKEFRNEAVALGIREMKELDGCMFCPCDQPLLQKKSLEALLREFEKTGKGIFRLSFGEKTGTPILFGKEYFEELQQLPQKCGGSYLAKKYPEQTVLVPAEHELELYDIDTPEDLTHLNSQAGCFM